MTDASRLRAVWRYPTDVYFGPGRIEELGEICRALGMARPLLVTDPGLAQLPPVHAARAALERAGLPAALFTDIKPNPVAANVRAGAEAYREGGHDGVIALGGGSALDAGKAVALMVSTDAPLWDFDVTSPNFDRDRPLTLPPLVAVPTTAGTGSEVGRAAVLTDEETHTKRILIHPGLLPPAVVADPALTVGLPAHVTAATGMDALAHNMEAYFSAVEYHPMADGVALEGMRLVHDWLPAAVKDGADIEARAHMMAAAAMGATAFQKGLGAIHALSHPVGALYDAHHGLTNAVVMPYVLAFNRPAIEDRAARLARVLGLAAPTLAAVMDWVLALREEIGIPHRLSALGVEEARVPELARMAAADPCAGENPVPAGAAEMERMYRDALAGRVA